MPPPRNFTMLAHSHPKNISNCGERMRLKHHYMELLGGKRHLIGATFWASAKVILPENNSIFSKVVRFAKECLCFCGLNAIVDSKPVIPGSMVRIRLAGTLSSAERLKTCTVRTWLRGILYKMGIKLKKFRRWCWLHSMIFTSNWCSKLHCQKGLN